MLGAGLIAFFFAKFRDLPSKGNGAVFATRAAHRDGQLAFTLLDIERQSVIQKILIPAQKLLCLRMPHNKIDDLLVKSGLVLELRHIERIGQSANVQHKVCFRRDAKLKAERQDIQTHGALGSPVLQEQVADAFFVLRR